MVKRKPVIAVDVDLTICQDVGLYWQDWLFMNYHIKNFEEFIQDCESNEIKYDLSKYFHIEDGGDPFDFWRNKTLYDNLSCCDKSKVVLKHLYDKGWEIIFATWCFGKSEHMESKHQMLRREYPFIKDEDFHFMNTKSKYLVNCQYAVDDRNSFCNQYAEDITVFKINTPFTQDQALTRNVFSVDSWNEIINLLEEK